MEQKVGKRKLDSVRIFENSSQEIVCDSELLNFRSGKALQPACNVIAWHRWNAFLFGTGFSSRSGALVEVFQPG